MPTPSLLQRLAPMAANATALAADAAGAQSSADTADAPCDPQLEKDAASPRTCCDCRMPKQQMVTAKRGLGKVASIYRRIDCNSYRGNRDRVLLRRFDLQNTWCGLATDERKSFIDEHRQDPDKFEASLEILVEEKRVQKLLRSFKGTGTFFDEHDLTDKYKKKPEVLAAILKNTRTFECPISNRTMYEEMVYTTMAENSEEHGIEKKRSLESTQKLKKAKQPKPSPTEEGGPDPPPNARKVSKVTDAFKKQLHSCVEAVTKAQVSMEAGLKQIEEAKLVAYMPPHMVSKVKATVAQAVGLAAEAEIIMDPQFEPNESFVAKDIKDRFHEAKVKAKELLRKLDLQIHEATEELGEKPQ